MEISVKNVLSIVLIVVVAVGTAIFVRQSHKPGHLDVIAAQAMDMSQMRPPTGAAPVELADVKLGSLSNSATYTGSVQAFNEQDISPRTTGTILSLSVYPGDTVHAGEIVALLDDAELSAKTREANANARAAIVNEQIADITHHLHHGAELDQSEAQLGAAQQGVSDAQAELMASRDAVTDAEAGVESAEAQASYWTTELVREKQLMDAGAASQQEYQNEQAQGQAAFAAVSAAKAKVSEAKEMVVADEAKVNQASRQVNIAQASVQMSNADILIAEGQAQQAGAGADAAQAVADEASVEEGYTRITAPINGVVVSRPVSPGTLVQPGTVILQVAQIDQVRVQANVAASDLVGIETGSPVIVTTQNGGTAIAATVTSVFPSANSETRTAIVETVIPNPGRKLLPGAFVSMRIDIGSSGADQLLVPAESIVSEGGQSYVWVARTSGQPSAGQIYECIICHIHYTAAQAKTFHYHDPMDGGLLVPVSASSSTSASTGPLTAHEVPVQVGDSDGNWTQVTAGELNQGDRVVDQGEAALSEGARVVASSWGADGPLTLPDAAAVNLGVTVYRCEICGMTYSAADAKKDNYVDPMDGGKLVPVTTPGR
jgi:multidrug efflux pump subunit AcrA (membrane-fusion protein)